jgi:hypothetical protein
MTEITLNIPKKIRKAAEKSAELKKITLRAYINKLLEEYTVPLEFIDQKVIKNELPELVNFFNTIPSVQSVSHSSLNNARWWIKFNIDINHPLSWCVVQNLGFVLNYISITERLPTVFMPTSPPPYLNGGPKYNLSWVIESTIDYVSPNYILSVLQNRLPQDIQNIDAWIKDEDEDFDKNNMIKRLCSKIKSFFRSKK